MNLSAPVAPYRRQLSVAAVALALVASGGCGEPEEQAGPEPSASATTSSLGGDPVDGDDDLAGVDFGLRLAPGVEAGESVDDESLEVVGERRAVVDIVTDGDGRVVAGEGPSGAAALRFPEYADGATGPAAIVRMTPAGTDWLSPGTSDVTFGVDVRLDETSSGSTRDNGDNVLQRGLFTDPSQFKIQADKHYPSCLVRGDAGQVEATVPLRLDPASWYRLVCTRSGDEVRLEVSLLGADGPGAPRTGKASGPIGALGFLSDTPLTLGGKLAEDGEPANATDQFNGSADRVFVNVG